MESHAVSESEMNDAFGSAISVRTKGLADKKSGQLVSSNFLEMTSFATFPGSVMKEKKRLDVYP